MKQFIFGLALGAFVVAPASATSFYSNMTHNAKNGTASTSIVAGGIVKADGSVGRGSGFALEHPATGHYIIRFTPGFFPTGCAAMVANPWAGRPLIANVAVTGCESKAPVFHIVVQRVDGILEDRHFSFIATGI